MPIGLSLVLLLGASQVPTVSDGAGAPSAAPASAAAPPAPAPMPEKSAAAAAGAIVIPARAAVELRIDATLSSRLSQTGETVPITLTAPLVVGGRELVPAGTTGRGEVVWAKKAGGSGAPGELVLAARFLSINGKQLRLRSMHVARAGDDRYRTVRSLIMAGAMMGSPVMLAGFLVKGRETEVPAGSLADALTAEDFVAGEGGATAPMTAPALVPARGATQDTRVQAIPAPRATGG